MPPLEDCTGDAGRLDIRVSQLRQETQESIPIVGGQLHGSREALDGADGSHLDTDQREHPPVLAHHSLVDDDEDDEAEDECQKNDQEKRMAEERKIQAIMYFARLRALASSDDGSTFVGNCKKYVDQPYTSATNTDVSEDRQEESCFRESEEKMRFERLRHMQRTLRDLDDVLNAEGEGAVLKLKRRPTTTSNDSFASRFDCSKVDFFPDGVTTSLQPPGFRCGEEEDLVTSLRKMFESTEDENKSSSNEDDPKHTCHSEQLQQQDEDVDNVTCSTLLGTVTAPNTHVAGIINTADIAQREEPIFLSLRAQDSFDLNSQHFENGHSGHYKVAVLEEQKKWDEVIEEYDPITEERAYEERRLENQGKRVAFVDSVVSDIREYPRFDLELKSFLFYTPQEMQTFRMEYIWELQYGGVSKDVDGDEFSDNEKTGQGIMDAIFDFIMCRPLCIALSSSWCTSQRD